MPTQRDSDRGDFDSDDKDPGPTGDPSAVRDADADQHRPKTDDDNDAVMVVSDAETAETGPARIPAEEVRQGHTGDHVRYILIASFLGAAIALFVIYWAFLR